MSRRTCFSCNALLGCVGGDCRFCKTGVLNVEEIISELGRLRSTIVQIDKLAGTLKTDLWAAREDWKKVCLEYEGEISKLSVKASGEDAETVERIAAFCHSQWAGWMKYLFSKSSLSRRCS